PRRHHHPRSAQLRQRTLAMRLPGRLAAAIEVLADVEQRRRPVSEALKAWGLDNRFAGAGDRAAIGNLVYDALRRRASHAFAMGSDSPRALVLAVALRDWGETRESLVEAFAGDRHAPEPPSEAEIAAAATDLAAAPPAIRADVPEWLAPSLERAFGPDWVEEGQGMAGRPLRPYPQGPEPGRYRPDPGGARCQGSYPSADRIASCGNRRRRKNPRFPSRYHGGKRTGRSRCDTGAAS